MFNSNSNNITNSNMVKHIKIKDNTSKGISNTISKQSPSNKQLAKQPTIKVLSSNRHKIKEHMISNNMVKIKTLTSKAIHLNIEIIMTLVTSLIK